MRIVIPNVVELHRNFKADHVLYIVLMVSCADDLASDVIVILYFEAW